jgi:hypothetical protein
MPQLINAAARGQRQLSKLEKLDLMAEKLDALGKDSKYNRRQLTNEEAAVWSGTFTGVDDPSVGKARAAVRAGQDAPDIEVLFLSLGEDCARIVDRAFHGKAWINETAFVAAFGRTRPKAATYYGPFLSMQRLRRLYRQIFQEGGGEGVNKDQFLSYFEKNSLQNPMEMASTPSDPHLLDTHAPDAFLISNRNRVNRVRHPQNILHMLHTPLSNVLLTSDADGLLQEWDASTLGLRQTVKHPASGIVNGLCYLGLSFYAVVTLGKITVYSLELGKHEWKRLLFEIAHMPMPKTTGNKRSDKRSQHLRVQHPRMTCCCPEIVADQSDDHSVGIVFGTDTGHVFFLGVKLAQFAQHSCFSADLPWHFDAIHNSRVVQVAIVNCSYIEEDIFVASIAEDGPVHLIGLRSRTLKLSIQHEAAPTPLPAFEFVPPSSMGLRCFAFWPASKSFVVPEGKVLALLALASPGAAEDQAGSDGRRAMFKKTSTLGIGRRPRVCRSSSSSSSSCSSNSGSISSRHSKGCSNNNNRNGSRKVLSGHKVEILHVFSEEQAWRQQARLEAHQAYWCEQIVKGGGNVDDFQTAQRKQAHQNQQRSGGRLFSIDAHGVLRVWAPQEDADPPLVCVQTISCNANRSLFSHSSSCLFVSVKTQHTSAFSPRIYPLQGSTLARGLRELAESPLRWRAFADEHLHNLVPLDTVTGQALVPEEAEEEMENEDAERGHQELLEVEHMAAAQIQAAARRNTARKAHKHRRQQKQGRTDDCKGRAPTRPSNAKPQPPIAASANMVPIVGTCLELGVQERAELSRIQVLRRMQLLNRRPLSDREYCGTHTKGAAVTGKAGGAAGRTSEVAMPVTQLAKRRKRKQVTYTSIDDAGAEAQSIAAASKLGMSANGSTFGQTMRFPMHILEHVTTVDEDHIAQDAEAEAERMSNSFYSPSKNSPRANQQSGPRGGSKRNVRRGRVSVRPVALVAQLKRYHYTAIEIEEIMQGLVVGAEKLEGLGFVVGSSGRGRGSGQEQVILGLEGAEGAEGAGGAEEIGSRRGVWSRRVSPADSYEARVAQLVLRYEIDDRVAEREGSAGGGGVEGDTFGAAGGYQGKGAVGGLTVLVEVDQVKQDRRADERAEEMRGIWQERAKKELQLACFKVLERRIEERRIMLLPSGGEANWHLEGADSSSGDGAGFDEEERVVVGSLFKNCCRVKLRRLHCSVAGSAICTAQSWDADGLALAPSIVRIDTVNSSSRHGDASSGASGTSSSRVGISAAGMVDGDGSARMDTHDAADQGARELAATPRQAKARARQAKARANSAGSRAETRQARLMKLRTQMLSLERRMGTHTVELHNTCLLLAPDGPRISTRSGSSGRIGAMKVMLDHASIGPSILFGANAPVVLQLLKRCPCETDEATGKKNRDLLDDSVLRLAVGPLSRSALRATSVSSAVRYRVPNSCSHLLRPTIEAMCHPSIEIRFRCLEEVHHFGFDVPALAHHLAAAAAIVPGEEDLYADIIPLSLTRATRPWWSRVAAILSFAQLSTLRLRDDGDLRSGLDHSAGLHALTIGTPTCAKRVLAGWMSEQMVVDAMVPLWGWSHPSVQWAAVETTLALLPLETLQDNRRVQATLVQRFETALNLHEELYKQLSTNEDADAEGQHEQRARLEARVFAEQLAAFDSVALLIARLRLHKKLRPRLAEAVLRTWSNATYELRTDNESSKKSSTRGTWAPLDGHLRVMGLLLRLDGRLLKAIKATMPPAVVAAVVNAAVQASYRGLLLSCMAQLLSRGLGYAANADSVDVTPQQLLSAVARLPIDGDSDMDLVEMMEYSSSLSQWAAGASPISAGGRREAEQAASKIQAVHRGCNARRKHQEKHGHVRTHEYKHRRKHGTKGKKAQIQKKNRDGASDGPVDTRIQGAALAALLLLDADVQPKGLTRSVLLPCFASNDSKVRCNAVKLWCRRQDQQMQFGKAIRSETQAATKIQNAMRRKTARRERKHRRHTKHRHAHHRHHRKGQKPHKQELREVEHMAATQIQAAARRKTARKAHKHRRQQKHEHSHQHRQRLGRRKSRLHHHHHHTNVANDAANAEKEALAQVCSLLAHDLSTAVRREVPVGIGAWSSNQEPQVQAQVHAAHPIPKKMLAAMKQAALHDSSTAVRVACFKAMLAQQVFLPRHVLLSVLTGWGKAGASGKSEGCVLVLALEMLVESARQASDRASSTSHPNAKPKRIDMAADQFADMAVDAVVAEVIAGVANEPGFATVADTVFVGDALDAEMSSTLGPGADERAHKKGKQKKHHKNQGYEHKSQKHKLQKDKAQKDSQKDSHKHGASSTDAVEGLIAARSGRTKNESAPVLNDEWLVNSFADAVTEQCVAEATLEFLAMGGNSAAGAAASAPASISVSAPPTQLYDSVGHGDNRSSVLFIDANGTPGTENVQESSLVDDLVSQQAAKALFSISADPAPFISLLGGSCCTNGVKTQAIKALQALHSTSRLPAPLLAACLRSNVVVLQKYALLLTPTHPALALALGTYDACATRGTAGYTPSWTAKCLYGDMYEDLHSGTSDKDPTAANQSQADDGDGAFLILAALVAATRASSAPLALRLGAAAVGAVAAQHWDAMGPLQERDVSSSSSISSSSWAERIAAAVTSWINPTTRDSDNPEVQLQCMRTLLRMCLPLGPALNRLHSSVRDCSGIIFSARYRSSAVQTLAWLSARLQPQPQLRRSQRGRGCNSNGANDPTAGSTLVSLDDSLDDDDDDDVMDMAEYFERRRRRVLRLEKAQLGHQRGGTPGLGVDVGIGLQFVMVAHQQHLLRRRLQRRGNGNADATSRAVAAAVSDSVMVELVMEAFLPTGPSARSSSQLQGTLLQALADPDESVRESAYRSVQQLQLHLQMGQGANGVVDLGALSEQRLLRAASVAYEPSTQVRLRVVQLLESLGIRRSRMRCAVKFSNGIPLLQRAAVAISRRGVGESYNPGDNGEVLGEVWRGLLLASKTDGSAGEGVYSLAEEALAQHIVSGEYETSGSEGRVRAIAFAGICYMSKGTASNAQHAPVLEALLHAITHDLDGRCRQAAVLSLLLIAPKPNSSNNSSHSSHLDRLVEQICAWLSQGVTRPRADHQRDIASSTDTMSTTRSTTSVNASNELQLVQHAVLMLDSMTDVARMEAMVRGMFHDAVGEEGVEEGGEGRRNILSSQLQQVAVEHIGIGAVGARGVESASDTTDTFLTAVHDDRGDIDGRQIDETHPRVGVAWSIVTAPSILRELAQLLKTPSHRLAKRSLPQQQHQQQQFLLEQEFRHRAALKLRVLRLISQLTMRFGLCSSPSACAELIQATARAASSSAQEEWSASILEADSTGADSAGASAGARAMNASSKHAANHAQSPKPVVVLAASACMGSMCMVNRYACDVLQRFAVGLANVDVRNSTSRSSSDSSSTSPDPSYSTSAISASACESIVSRLFPLLCCPTSAPFAYEPVTRLLRRSTSGVLSGPQLAILEQLEGEVEHRRSVLEAKNKTFKTSRQFQRQSIVRSRRQFVRPGAGTVRGTVRGEDERMGTPDSTTGRAGITDVALGGSEDAGVGEWVGVEVAYLSTAPVLTNSSNIRRGIDLQLIEAMAPSASEIVYADGTCVPMQAALARTQEERLRARAHARLRARMRGLLQWEGELWEGGCGGHNGLPETTGIAGAAAAVAAPGAVADASTDTHADAACRQYWRVEWATPQQNPDEGRIVYSTDVAGSRAVRSRIESIGKNWQRRRRQDAMEVEAAFAAETAALTTVDGEEAKDGEEGKAALVVADTAAKRTSSWKTVGTEDIDGEAGGTLLARATMEKEHREFQQKIHATVANSHRQLGSLETALVMRDIEDGCMREDAYLLGELKDVFAKEQRLAQEKRESRRWARRQQRSSGTPKGSEATPVLTKSAPVDPAATETARESRRPVSKHSERPSTTSSTGPTKLKGLKQTKARGSTARSGSSRYVPPVHTHRPTTKGGRPKRPTRSTVKSSTGKSVAEAKKLPLKPASGNPASSGGRRKPGMQQRQLKVFNWSALSNFSPTIPAAPRRK